MISILVNPLVEIAASLILGAIMGWILTQLEKLFNSNTNRLNLTIAAVFLTAMVHDDNIVSSCFGGAGLHFGEKEEAG